jgi:predicted transcriptional regulator
LEREEVIKSRIDGKFKRYYPWDCKIEQKPWLSDLQNNMIQMIKVHPGISTNDLVERAGGSRSNGYYHISELESKGLIRVDKMEKKHKCYLVQDT